MHVRIILSEFERNQLKYHKQFSCSIRSDSPTLTSLLVQAKRATPKPKIKVGNSFISHTALKITQLIISLTWTMGKTVHARILSSLWIKTLPDPTWSFTFTHNLFQQLAPNHSIAQPGCHHLVPTSILQLRKRMSLRAITLTFQLRFPHIPADSLFSLACLCLISFI